jgi:hypothetical protein
VLLAGRVVCLVADGLDAAVGPHAAGRLDDLLGRVTAVDADRRAAELPGDAQPVGVHVDGEPHSAELVAARLGTALFGGGSGGSGGRSGAAIPALVHNAQAATLVNLGFVLAALSCTAGLPRRLAGRAGESEPEKPVETPAEREAAETDASAAEAPAQR